ncbi:predicted protein [Nematostella vectensis]|uniref:Lipocalin/cytosolic fatty-acid binding domain-containing protein n=1 Tax=Nematostella vectensis TaxID=45351 RepID=A7SH61_NEMVE|nr:outer membrane lipoprotein Blc [Nematostella vectensis]EDO36993.1 predicted protein [Nematostella vectensis]|eukprot:XP_001629056.1 predicted protein [Nematostella vectensis]
MLLLFASFALLVCGPCQGIDTVPTLNVTSYLGRWYQMYSDFIVEETFERNAVCVTADYTLRKDGKIGVVNSNRDKKPDGELKQITGYAYQPDPEVPGKLKVHFDTVPVEGSYWILKLGPVSGGQYQYSIVTDGLKATLFVLSRDPNNYEKYDKEIQEFLKNNGFTHLWNKPRKTYQSEDCKYAPKPGSPYQTLRSHLDQ